MPDITPGTTHFSSPSGETACGVEYTSEWEETDDAEIIVSAFASDINCENCIRNLEP